MNTVQPIDFARRHFRDYRHKGNEIQPKYCLYCRGGKHHDRYTFSMNLSNGTFNCKRGSCGVTGTFYKLLLDFGEIRIMETKEYKQIKKTYKKSVAQKNQLSPKVMEYIKLRGISAATCEAYKIGEDDKGNIVLPFYKDGKQVSVKYRPARKIKDGEPKMWREKDTDSTALFGLQSLRYNREYDFPWNVLVITEGEFDAMAVYESGCINSISIPNGCEDFSWIEANWDWLTNQISNIIICGDNDEPGQSMIQTLAVKLGDWNVKIAELPDSCKDANEVLVKHGKSALYNIMENAKEIPVESLVRMSEVKSLDIENMPKVASGIKGLDRKIGGFLMGQVSVWTGVNGSGKSTLIGQLLIETIEQKANVCVFSGELPNPLFRYWIELQMAGPTNIAYKYDRILEANIPYIETQTALKIRAWYHDNVFLYDSMAANNIESVMKVFSIAARRYNCKVFLVDNLMMLIGGTEDNYYRKQSEFLKLISAFAKKFEAHVHVVAHPRKVNGRVTKMDIAGSSDITNLADNVFGVHRLTAEEKADKEFEAYAECDALLDVFKSRFSGRQEITIGLKFHEDSKRFYMAKDHELLQKQYGWTSAFSNLNLKSNTDTVTDTDIEQCPF